MLSQTLAQIGAPFANGDFWPVVMRFMPFVIFYELPYTLLVYLGVWKYRYERCTNEIRAAYFPDVSCIVTCYGEGEGVRQTIRSLSEQIYPGSIEIIAMIDGAAANKDTYEAALEMEHDVKKTKGRNLIVVPKWQRGGRVSNVNTGLNYAANEIIMVLDGDTSFDNNMVERATRHFADPAVVAVSGCLRVRNADTSLVASLQAVEYFISIQTAKAGLSEYNIVNNISGAFGVFRKKTIDLVWGWDAGTAEDLDLTLRIKQYFGRYKKNSKIVFDPEAIGFTDVPETLGGYFRQRQRWDGDLPFIYFKKHNKAFTPALIGWRNFLMIVVTGLYSQIVLPFIIFLYTLWLFYYYPLYYLGGLMFVVYLFYFIMLSVMYLTAVFFISERRASDLSRVPLLLIFPLFTFVSRINGMAATLYEFFSGAHKDSSMAPWWVTKKSKFN